MFFSGGGVVCTGKPTAAMRRMVHPPFNSYSSFINPPPDILSEAPPSRNPDKGAPRLQGGNSKLAFLHSLGWALTPSQFRASADTMSAFPAGAAVLAIWTGAPNLIPVQTILLFEVAQRSNRCCSPGGYDSRPTTMDRTWDWMQSGLFQ